MADSIVHSAALALAKANAACENQRSLAERMSQELRRAQVLHDEAVEDSIKTGKLLPTFGEQAAIEQAIRCLPLTATARVLARYLERLKAARPE